VGCQLLADAFDGGEDPRIGGWKESDERNDQRAGIQHTMVERLHEGTDVAVEPFGRNGVTNLIARAAPVWQVTLQASRCRQANRAVQGYPAEELGMEKMARGAPYLPDTVIGLVPVLRRAISHRAQHTPEIGLNRTQP